MERACGRLNDANTKTHDERTRIINRIIKLEAWNETTTNNCRADGGDIGTGRLRDIADNPYGD
jgi:hypothetical protein